MRFNQIEYTKFLKMLLHNFTYDDGKESEFIYNYEHVSALEPSKFFYWWCFNTSNNIDPIDVAVDFSDLSLVKTDEEYLDP